MQLLKIYKQTLGLHSKLCKGSWPLKVAFLSTERRRVILQMSGNLTMAYLLEARGEGEGEGAEVCIYTTFNYDNLIEGALLDDKHDK